MRLVFVHGRAQGRWADDLPGLREIWVDALAAGSRAAGIDPLPADADLRLPYYGRRLDDLTAAAAVGVARGPRTPAADPVADALLLQIAARAGVSDAEITAELDELAVERGPGSWPWVRAAARALSRHSPWLGETVAARFTADVSTYLLHSDVRQEINETVSADITGVPTVVVGHSLGSIVAYWALTDLARRADIRLFVTVGSPLGIDEVKRHLPRPLGRPAGVRHWLNAADERDPVALFPRLDRDVFPGPDENLSDVHNPRESPHGIAGYLADAVVARRIVEASRATE